MACNGAEVKAKMAASATVARCSPTAALRFSRVSVRVDIDPVEAPMLPNTDEVFSIAVKWRLSVCNRSTATALNMIAKKSGIG